MIAENKAFEILRDKKNQGMLLVVSAPSGAGKTTICRKVVSRIRRAVFSISVTSRKPRPDEKQGVDYFFVDKTEFENKIRNNELLEWAEVHGQYYGTSKKFTEDSLSEGKYVVLDIDVQGGLQIKEKFPRAVLIFIVPPSMEELRKRLITRGQDSDEEIEKRLNNANREMESISSYNYIVENDRLEEAVEKIICIVKAEECRI